LADAKWFLALRWCDQLAKSAGIINNTGELSFVNQIVLEIGTEKFIPQQYRLDIFTQCLSLQPNETVTYDLHNGDRALRNTSSRNRSSLWKSRFSSRNI